MKRSLLGLAFIPLLAAPTGAPCIWDRDTLNDELRGLPDAWQLIVGRWYRHGKAYYQKRVDTLPAHLAKKPDDLSAYDDLAVAYEMLRQRDKAIAVMARKKKALDAKANEEHLYRYHANLGTFYAHSGRWAEAEKEISIAIRINPQAHFGREIIQLDAIRYVAAAKKDPTLWTKHNFLTFNRRFLKKKSWRSLGGAMSFTAKKRYARKDEGGVHWSTWKEAYTGVAGMLRFGGLEGAELYRVLGDLFASNRDLHLAWWSWQRAIERGHPAKAQILKAIAGVEKHWREASKIAGKMHKLPTMAMYREHRGHADRWLEAFLKAERAALAAGKDPGDTKTLEELIASADKAVPMVVPSAKSKGGRGVPGKLQKQGVEPDVDEAQDAHKGKKTKKRKSKG